MKVVESTEDVDPKTKIEILRKEQASIKAEKKAAKAEAEAQKKEILTPGPLSVDNAELIKAMTSETCKLFSS